MSEPKPAQVLYCDVHGTELQREACNHVRTCEQCLAAEREKVKHWKWVADETQSGFNQLKEQLAAEQERYDVMVEDQERVSYRLRSQRDTLVDTLRDLSKHYVGNVQEIADAALAKVENR